MNPLNEDVAVEVATPALPIETEIAAPSYVSDLMMLTKARLSMLVLVTTFVGFCMASPEAIDWFLLFRALFGTALIAASAAVLNQFIERKVDRLMDRTKHRPLPAGRMRPSTALGLGVLLAVAGFIYMLNRVNTPAALLAAATLAVYLAFYTPLKRRSSICVSVGAISGAIPPMIGWAAARPSVDAGAWILFAVLFFWQMPHFLAIAWMYRDEYAQAGFVMLRPRDIGGLCTARKSLLSSIALTIVTIIPICLKMVAPWYLLGAIVCNAVLVTCAVQFLVSRDRSSARRLFFASIFYLPLLLGLMVFAKN